MLILVVGPSGVGKDSLLDAARARLDERFVFVRRQISRPREAGGEDHEPVSEAAFKAKADAGGYALWWQAHGLFYGADISILDELAAGRTVVLNASREIVAEARRRFADLRIVSIAADMATVADRLALRGRETAEQISARLARGQALAVTGPDVVTVRNDGTLEDGVAAFLAALTR